MRTTEQIDADIAQAERSMGMYVDYAGQYEHSVSLMVSELSRVREERQKIERLREERTLADQESTRRSDIAFGYFITAFGLGCIGFGVWAIVWGQNGVPGGLIFIAFGIGVSALGFGPAQRAHARKKA